MQLTFYKNYGSLWLKSGSDFKNNYSGLVRIRAEMQKFAKVTANNLFSIAAVAHPFLWLNLKFSIQQIINYFRLLQNFSVAEYLNNQS